MLSWRLCKTKNYRLPGRALVRPTRRQICSAPMIGRSKMRPYNMLIINILTASKMLKETSDCFGKVFFLIPIFTNLIFLDGLGFIPSTTRSYNHGCQPNTYCASLRKRYYFPTSPMPPHCVFICLVTGRRTNHARLNIRPLGPCVD